MRIVSANLNQRLGNPAARSRVERWLQTKVPDLFLAQEPFKPNQQDRPAVAGYRLVSSSSLVSCWIAQRHACPTIIEHSERWHEIRLDGVCAHNVYLSPYSSGERRAMLEEVASAISGSDTTVVITGDFNLAPRSEDGMFGDQPSTFTKPAERRAFEDLLSTADLIDATCPSAGRNVEFTFERVQQGRQTRFRCDLALVSSHSAGRVAVVYDHSVRAVPDAFTDHSALIVDVETTDVDRLVSDQVVTGTGMVERDQGHQRVSATAITASASHKTAIKRQSPSQIARKLDEQGVLSSLAVHSILDFGCGYGADVEYYRSKGYDTDGFDVEPRFGWTQVNKRLRDLVTLVFVVNVLPTSEDRLSAVRDAARQVRPGGYLLIAARSESAISAEARKGNWAPFNDGWISAPQKGTFQKGIAPEELAWCAGAIGFRIAECSLRLSSDVSWLLCRRPE